MRRHGVGGVAEGYKVDLRSRGILEIPRFCGKLFMKNAKEHTDSPLRKDKKTRRRGITSVL